MEIDRPAWHPALPRQHRHGYAAGLHRDLPTGTPSRLRSRPPTPDGRALHPGPYPPDLSRCHAYGALPLIPLRIPSDLARRTRPVWQYQTVPALSALLPALPGVSRIRLRSAPTRLLRQPGEEVLHLPRFPAPHGAPAPRGAHSTEVQQRPLTTASQHDRQHPKLAGLTVKRPVAPLVRDEEASVQDASGASRT
jgi:hypothetical protein